MALYASLISFRRLIPVFLTLLAVSAAIAFTASTFMGAYRTAVGLMGTGSSDVLLIYGASARAPQTSVVPLSLYEKLRGIDGVEAISPEAVSIAMIGDEVVVVRGIDPSVFPEISGIRLVAGSLSLDGSASALIGENLARKMRLGVGDTVLLRSAFSDAFLEVKVVGVFRSGSYLDDELLVPLYAGQWLRGLPRDAVSLIRVKIDPGKLGKEELASLLRSGRPVSGKASPQPESELMRLLTIPRARRFSMNYAVRSPEESMRSFLERQVKVNEVAVWSAVATVISGSILLVYLTSSTMIVSHSREISVLRGLGASRRNLVTRSAILAVFSSLITGVIGFFAGLALSNLFSDIGLIRVGPYSVRPVFDVYSLAMTLIAVASVSAVAAAAAVESIIRGDYLGG
ncbi:MAG: ABC transporter permease [Thaumarchaeota archaeon]|nr:ABC transporter permease [Nitrososphaerota archaeon]